jgi:glycosyltransferase involved in cell wall biosynthesis
MPAHPVSLVTGRPRPTFSVIVATYNRGAHIRPTVLSALEQSFRDFELIVVADGCTDDTLDIVQEFGSLLISTYRLTTNSGSQSAPNNFGIAQSSGRFIAYLGHDDVWQPDHLANLAEVFSRSPSPQVAASGCIYHGPGNSGIYFVTGLLDEEHNAADHFLPPSSLAHTRDLFDVIGPWPEPDSVSAPVDAEFMLRAIRAGATFASTGKITAHKFAAGHRYLSYLRPASSEQTAMLSALRSCGQTSNWNDVVEASKRQGRYMVMKYFDYEAYCKGCLFEQNRSNKGLRKPPLREIVGKEVLTQTEEPRGLDWHALELSDQPYRWSGPSPKPQVLIPFKGDCAAHLSLYVKKGTPAEVLGAMSFDQDGQTIPHVLDASVPGYTRVEVDLRLRPHDYSILGITTPRMFQPDERTDRGDTRLLGIALGNVEIARFRNGFTGRR